jgi:methyl-accepting chemotaxis protein
MSENTLPDVQALSAEATDKPDFVSDPVLSGDAPTAAAADAAVPASAPAPAPAAPAVHAGISVDERAYEQYQALAKTVLDSAEIASRSAEAAMAIGRDMKLATGQFREATSQFNEMSDAGYKKARLLLAIGGGVMVVCLLFFLIMGVRMVSRINKLDVMMEAVGKRVIDLNSGMESLEGLNRSVQELSAKQTALTKAQGEIESRIDAQLKQSENLVQKVPGETAKQVAATSDTLKREVQGINSRLQSQANAVQSLGNEVKALKGSVGNVDGLKRDVEALVTLQRERYLEALQKNNATSAKERSLQYPRVQPAKPGESPAPGNGAVGPVVVPAAKP